MLVFSNISILLLLRKKFSEHEDPVCIFMRFQIKCMYYGSVIYMQDKNYTDIGILKEWDEKEYKWKF